MDNRHTNKPEKVRIDSEAAHWVAKRIQGFSPQEQDEFLDWLTADPRHNQAYGDYMKIWTKLDMLAQWNPEHSDQPNPELLRKNRRGRILQLWIGLAASVVLGAFIWSVFSGSQTNDRADEQQKFVAHSYEKHTLLDGSTIEMKDGSALEVNFTKEERRIELVSSEVHFDVKENKDAPFIVQVKDIEFRAVGTAFSVGIREDEVELLVTEGRVQVSKNNSLANATGNVSILNFGEVVAGQKSTVSLAAPDESLAIRDVSSLEIDEFLKWKPKSLNFDQVPLASVIEEFNRRNEVQIEIQDEAVGQMIVVASFHSPNVEKLIDLLESTLDIQAQQAGPDRVVLYKVKPL